jgi:hypothetical protein
MTYRISYDHRFAASTSPRGHEGATRTEYFRGEREALRRARKLIENGDYHAVAVHHGTGSVLTGVLLQLKLGAAIAD